jgi:hypothetical protein
MLPTIGTKDSMGQALPHPTFRGGKVNPVSLTFLASQSKSLQVRSGIALGR